MKIVSVSSGKGGVGKTTVTCSLALAIAELNKRVVIIDGDLGLANVDIVARAQIQAARKLGRTSEGARIASVDRLRSIRHPDAPDSQVVYIYDDPKPDNDRHSIIRVSENLAAYRRPD